MADFEVKRKKGYTVMSNHHLQNGALSLKAKGLLSYMLSLPEDWDYSIAGLAVKNKEGRAAIRAALEELEAFGYLRRERVRADGGTFAGSRYFVYEEPLAQETAAPEEAVPVPGNTPKCENRTLVEEDAPMSDYPTLENPTSENPTSENRTELSTKEQMTKEPPLSPKGKRRGGLGADSPEHQPERFAGFWRFYPRHEDKRAAVAEWDKLKPSETLIEQMGQALTRQKQSPDWQRGVGIPYACRWLKRRRWEDESAQGAATPPHAVSTQRVMEDEEVYRLG